ncbi:ribonuclease P protein component [Reichenbachiella versicolor]|uniref:ribonuclease P protein component n=1 Tax=Reichenbachiella versicolor TaxID=1821036 RepID=UPI000D6E0193|nr:ribonuclease P protein component [Reichenbachiella versicolor]
MKEKTDIATSYSFPKKERISSKKLIDALFNKGASFHIYPFMIKYLPNSEVDAVCHQVLVSVSKKRFKRAVDRNRVKRLVKEAYRLNKPHHLQKAKSGNYWLIAYIYVGKKIHSYQMIEKKLIESFHRLAAKDSENPTPQSK